MSKIDFSKPIRVVTSGDERLAFVLRTFNNGTALVAIDRDDDSSPIIMNDKGDFVGQPNTRYSAQNGSALRIENVPEKPKTYTLELTAKEMAMLRVLVGGCTGEDSYSVTKSLYRKVLPLVGDSEDSIQACTINPRVDVSGPAFKRLVEAYSKG